MKITFLKILMIYHTFFVLTAHHLQELITVTKGDE